MSDKMSYLMDNISQFIHIYYLDPIRTDSGYNPVNTFTWAVVLGICIFGVFRLLEKLEVKITPRFIASVLPFVLAGSSLRVFADSPAGIVHPPLSYSHNSQYLLHCVWGNYKFLLGFPSRLQKTGQLNDFHLIFASFGLGWFFTNIIILRRFRALGSHLCLLVCNWDRNRIPLFST